METKPLLFVCPICSTSFLRRRCELRRHKGKPCCSLRCAALRRGEDNFRDLQARFDSRTRRKGDCVVWLGHLDADGYGFMSVRGSELRAHHISVFLGSGAWPPEDKVVMHTCDNPSCVLYAHLRVGDQAENLLDMRLKNRHSAPKGERATFAKLTEIQVREIRTRLARGGITQTAIALEYGVHRSVVSRLSRGEAWGHV